MSHDAHRNSAVERKRYRSHSRREERHKRHRSRDSDSSNSRTRRHLRSEERSRSRSKNHHRSNRRLYNSRKGSKSLSVERKSHRSEEEEGNRGDSKASQSDGLSFNKGYFLENLKSKEFQREFELSNYDKAYGLDLSGFAGLSSEILSIGTLSKEKEFTRAERRKFRREEIELHKDRFWKCKKCSFMNYLSNYACHSCKGLKGSCAI